MANLTNKIISSNFQRLLQVDSHVVQDGTGSATALQLSGSSNVGIGVAPEDGLGLKVQGTIKTSGDIIAENYIVSSSVTYMTQSFASGSNTFGNTSDDVHIFTGSISASGNIETQGDIHLLNTKALKIENAAGTLTQVVKVDSGDDIYIGHPNFDNIFLQGSGGTLMTLLGTGNVGIGTTAPTRHLNIHTGSTGNVYLKLSNGTSGNTAGSDGFDFAFSGTNMSFINRENGAQIFETNGVERLRILNSGEVGIGTTTPTKPLQVEGDISASGFISTDSHITASGNISASGTGNFGGNVLIGGSSLTNPQSWGKNLQVINAGSNGASISVMDSNNEYNIATYNGSLFISDGTAERVSLLSDGKVGIGTTSPSELLEISSDSDPTFVIRTSASANDADSGKISFREASDTERVNLRYDGSANKFRIDMEGNEGALVIQKSDGFTGLGTAVPTTRLQVEGSISASGDLFVRSGSFSKDIVLDNYLDTAIRFVDGSGGALNNFLDYRRWASSATAGKEITNATGTIKLESKNVSNGLILSGSNVGIGTSPITDRELTIYDDDGDAHLLIRSNTDNAFITLDSNDDGAGGEESGILFSSNRSNKWEVFKDSGDDFAIHDFTRSGRVFRIADNGNMSLMETGGNVGIGTTVPTVALQVTGDISASGFISTDSHISASGNISSSGIIYGTNAYLGDDAELRTTAGHLTIRPEEDLKLGTVSTDNVLIGRTDAGTTTIQSLHGLNVTTNITASGNISMAGDNKLLIGASDDLQISHNGSDSFIIDSGTGNLYIRAADDLRIQATSTNEDMIKASKDGAVELYYNNVKKIETTDDAATITATNMTMKVGVDTIGTIFSSSGTHASPDVLITDKDDNDARAALQVQGNAGATEVLFASSTGKVGIGTTSPDFASGTGLMISDSTQANLRLADGSDYTDVANSAGDLFFINRKSTGRILFRVNNATEAIRIAEDGAVGIGDGFQNLDPKNGLHVTGSDGTASGIRQSRAGSKIWSQEIDSSGRLQWSYRSTEAGSKTTTFTLDDTNDVYFPEGKVGIGTATPPQALTVTGHISSSGNTDFGNDSADKHNFVGNITASGNISSSGYVDINQLYVDDGTEALPSIAFGLGGQEDTGLYRRANNSIGFSAGGDVMAVISPEGVAIGGTYAGNNSQPTSNGLIVQGNVGVGIITPTKPLQVEGAISASGIIHTNNEFELRESAGTDVTARLYNSSDDGTLDVYSDGTVDARIHGNGTSFFKGGNVVAIGTSTAAANMELTVEGDISASGDLFSSKLNVFGPSGGSGQIYINDSDNGIGVADGLFINKSGTNAFVYNRDTGNFSLGTNDDQQVTITENEVQVKASLEFTSGSIVSDYNTGHAAIRRGSDGSMQLDAPGNIIANIDTNDNETQAEFRVTRDGGTATIFRVSEGGHITSSANVSSSFTSTGSFGRVNSQTGFFEAGSKISDYVFEPEYVLRTLPQVEQHISESKHLPGIPGEAEIEQWRNLSMGERDRLLLEKIEELTLYVISLQKQIDELKDKN